MTRFSRTFVGFVFTMAASMTAMGAFVPTAALAEPGAPTTTTDPVPANPPALPSNSNVSGTTDTASERETTRAPSGDEAQRYADLEASSGDVGEFRGGSAGVYIGIGSGAAIVLLVILLVILL